MRRYKNPKRQKEISEAKRICKERLSSCEGCNRNASFYDASHVIPESRRKDLASEQNNLRKLCRKCHIFWETHSPQNMSKLKCFAEDMEYIYEVDRTYWFQIMGKAHNILEIQDEIKQERTKYYKIPLHL